MVKSGHLDSMQISLDLLVQPGWLQRILQVGFWEQLRKSMADLFYFILFLFFREKGKEGEREGEKHQNERETLISCLLHTPLPGSNWKPRHVPWPGIELGTFHFAELHPTNWATPVRAGQFRCRLTLALFINPTRRVACFQELEHDLRWCQTTFTA